MSSGAWGWLRVVAKDDLFEAYLGNEKLFEVQDRTFAEPGKVGGWTKADSVIHLEDLRVTVD